MTRHAPISCQYLDDVIRWAERFSSELAKLPAKYNHKP
jgi:hypothetical protein